MKLLKTEMEEKLRGMHALIADLRGFRLNQNLEGLENGRKEGKGVFPRR